MLSFRWNLVDEQIFTGEQPFSHLFNDGMVALAVVNGDHPTKPTSEERRLLNKRGLNHLIWRTLESGWNHEPANRPRIEEVLDRLNRSQMKFS